VRISEPGFSFYHFNFLFDTIEYMQKGDLVTQKQNDYELMDSGNGEKLERYGKFVLARPDPQAIWSKSLSNEEWNKADAVFYRTGKTGKWVINTSVPNSWLVDFDGLFFNLKLLPSKHLGVFPEQQSHWKWLEDSIKKEISSGRKISVLNLFAYTGGASMAAARAGADVCHIDSSKFAVDMTNMNLSSSKLKDKTVRLIIDDVRKFVEREIKRGAKYDIVLMDPPVYGKGIKDEVWQIEEDLQPLVTRIKSVLSEKPVAVILNGYSSIYSSTTYSQILSNAFHGMKGEVHTGELLIQESSKKRFLPAGIFAKWVF